MRVSRTGAKPHRSPSRIVFSSLRRRADGDKVELPVLLISDGKSTVVGSAPLQDKTVTAEILEQFKGDKVRVFKFKKRKRYQRDKGHRQQLTKIKIASIPA